MDSTAEFAAKRLTKVLTDAARDLEDAAANMRRLAEQAADPTYKDRAGREYHHLAARMVPIIANILPHVNVAAAFDMAGLADREWGKGD
jgi:hypothetical protein